MLLKPIKSLFIVTLLFNLVTNMAHIYYFCVINLNGELLKYMVYYYSYSSNWLQLIMGKLTIDFIDLRNKVLSKKIRWDIKITQMDEMFIPWECGMEITSHMDPIFHNK